MREKKQVGRSTLHQTWRQFRRNRLAVFGLCILALLIIMAVCADAIAPYGYETQDLTNTFQTPNATHWFGTDNFGRDIFSRLVYGSRTSLLIGIFSVGIGATIGGLAGATAAFYGNKVDNIIMRTLDVIAAVPQMVLAIAISAALGTGLFNTMVAIGIARIPSYARVVRSSVLVIKEQEYIEACKAMGSSDWRTILRHIIPNSLAPVIVQASLGIAQAILTAASLSFIGLGLQPPNPEWGAMLTGGREYMLNYPHMVIFPGLMIMITVFAINAVGDGLRDATDPRLKR